MSPRFTLLALSFLALARAACAQAAEPPAGLPSALLVPVHTHDAGDPGYGVWTAAPSYRASFHDGFAFYPRPTRLDAPAHRWQWRTRGEGTHSQPSLTHTPHRVEIAHNGCREVYDVREEGVEQSFVLATRPTEPGFAIRGRITTDLHAAPRAQRHEALVFHDDTGEPVLRYGAAFAFDAKGDRIALASSYDGAQIALHVPDAWLAQASYPVTIDPLTSRANVVVAATLFYEQYSNVQIARDSGTGHLLVSYTGSFGTSDTDSYAWLCNADFSNPVLVYSDVNATRFSTPLGAAFVRGSQRFVILDARQNNTSPFTPVPVCYAHASGNTTLNSGTTTLLPLAAGKSIPSGGVGGCDSVVASDNAALLVYEVRAGGVTEDVYGRLFRPALGTFGPEFTLSSVAAGTTFERRTPSVSQTCDGSGSSWVAAWQETDKTVAGDDADVHAARITYAGVRAGSALVTPGVTTPIHKVAPVVDGGSGRYLVAYALAATASATSGPLWARRFDWSEAASAPTLLAERVVSATNVTRLDVAFDTKTRSHWALSWSTPAAGLVANELHVARVGGTGGTTEHTVQVAPTTGVLGAWNHTSITFVPTSGMFAFCMKHSDYNASFLDRHSVQGQRLLYPVDALNVLYGTGCGGTIGATAPPYAGHLDYALTLTGATPNSVAVIEIAGAPYSLELSIIGMAGCYQNVDPGATLITTIALPTDAGGKATFPLPIQDFPLVTGNLYFMWGYLAPGANPLGVLATRGLRMQIR